METIDKLTLELLMNKNTYNRYIEKTDPSKHKEEQQFRKKINKYKARMISLTIKHLDNPNFQINNELTSIISEYAKTFIKYFEMNDLEISSFYSNENEEDADENILFGKIDSNDEIDCSIVTSNDETITTEQANKFLYKYTMDNYVKRK
jgi:hypothetical protein